MDDVTRIEVHNVAPYGPPRILVIRTETGARAFAFRSYETSDDGMVEAWTLGPEMEPVSAKDLITRITLVSDASPTDDGA